jgi:hypothetical protein
MALVPMTLQAPLTQLFTLSAPTADQSAEIMANAYASYVSTAMFGPSIPLFTGQEKVVMKATLLAAMNPNIPNPAGFAGAWVAGITSFWLSPPVQVVGPLVGPVTVIPGIGALLGAMLPLLIIPSKPAALAAAGLTAAIAAATATVTATLTPPPGGAPVPIV